MKLWIDDVREPPNVGYVWVKSVNEAKKCIESQEELVSKTGFGYWRVSIINIDHDAGDYANDGGDYIKLLDWLEETGRNYPIFIHSMNPVGRENMRAIIRRNGWTEVF